MKNKIIIAAILAIAIGIPTTNYALANPDFDTWCDPLKVPPFNAQVFLCTYDIVQMFDDIANHETRITNLESSSCDGEITLVKTIVEHPSYSDYSTMTELTDIEQLDGYCIKDVDSDHIRYDASGYRMRITVMYANSTGI